MHPLIAISIHSVAVVIAILLGLSSCSSFPGAESHLESGRSAVRISSVVHERSRSAIDPIEDFEGQELGYELGLGQDASLLVGLGQREYDLRFSEPFDTTEYSLGLRRYGPPIGQTKTYLQAGLRYGDLPGSDDALDWDTGLGLVFPVGAAHIDLGATWGLPLGDGSLSPLTELERNQLTISVGLGWAF